MLVDIDTQVPEIMKRIDTGVYVPLTYNFRHLLTDNGWLEFNHEWPEFASPDASARLKAFSDLMRAGELFPEYGSCDSPEQFFETDDGRRVIRSPWPLLVTFVHMTKQDHPGYRWHKNGPYLGLHEAEREHLGDEPTIQEIWQFHVFRRDDTFSRS